MLFRVVYLFPLIFFPRVLTFTCRHHFLTPWTAAAHDIYAPVVNVSNEGSKTKKKPCRKRASAGLGIT
jgi:hypothetical protein